MALPSLTDAVNRFGKSYPVFGDFLQLLTAVTPLIGAAIGLWIAALLRRAVAPKG